MSRFPHPFAELLIASCLIIFISGNAQGKSWVNSNPNPLPAAEALVAQRKEIEEIKVIFARIDARIVQIDKIHRQIESILKSYEATTTCVALGQISYTRKELVDRLKAAPSAAEKTTIQKDLDLYEKLFAKASQAASHFECPE